MGAGVNVAVAMVGFIAVMMGMRRVIVPMVMRGRLRSGLGQLLGTGMIRCDESRSLAGPRVVEVWRRQVLQQMVHPVGRRGDEKQKKECDDRERCA
jgi:hypothetical protein